MFVCDSDNDHCVVVPWDECDRPRNELLCGRELNPSADVYLCSVVCCSGQCRLAIVRTISRIGGFANQSAVYNISCSVWQAAAADNATNYFTVCCLVCDNYISVLYRLNVSGGLGDEEERWRRWMTRIMHYCGQSASWDYLNYNHLLRI